MFNKNFLAQYGDVKTREKLSAENGQHENHLYITQPPTRTMIDNSLKSPNYNAQLGAISSGKLEHDQIDQALKVNPNATLSHVTIPVDKLKKYVSTTHEYNVGQDVTFNTIRPDRPYSDKVDAIKTVLNHHNNLYRVVSEYAHIVTDLPKEVHGDLMDHIIKHDNPVSARNVLNDIYHRNAKDPIVHPEHVEKLLNHFSYREYGNLHTIAASGIHLTDDRIKENLKSPHLKMLMQKNRHLSPSQLEMVNNHKGDSV
jgi:hypothetical protein